jgi:ATP-dependent RNA helicase SUPV3L1/SUV3
MRRLKENAMLEAEITTTGDVMVEGQHVGHLDGFRFHPDPNVDTREEARALRAAAQKALAGEIDRRTERIVNAANGDLVLASDGSLRWQGAAIAKLVENDDALKPRLVLLADEALPAPQRDRVQARIDLWLTSHLETLLMPLFDLRGAETLTPAARGLAFRLSENLGIIERSEIADEVKALDQDARAGLRALGVRFGAYHIYVPTLLKPAPSGLVAMLWALKHGGLDIAGLPELTRLASSGRTSVPIDAAIPAPLYRVVGYRPAGSRAVRIDILERLADIIRPLIAWRPTTEQPNPPNGAINGYGFTATVAMTSLLGCSGEDFAGVLRSLGYRVERRPAPKKAEAAPAAEAATTTASESVPEATSAEPTAPEADALIAAPAAEAPADAVETEPAVDTPTTAAPAEATAETSVDAQVEAPAEAKPEEPQFIEIWRPGRKERDQHPPRPQRHRRPHHQAKPAAEAATPVTAEEGASVAAAQPAAAEHEHRRRHDRHRNEEGEQPRHHEGRPRRDGRRGNRENRDERTQRDDRPRREARGEPVRFSTEPPKGDRRNRPVDPTSPFAALAALKAELEAKERRS